MRTSEDLNICQRILAVYKDVVSIYKSGEIDMGGGRSYSVVTYDGVVSALHLPLAKHGIVIWPTQKSCIVSQFEKKSSYNGQEKVTIYYRADVVVEMKLFNADKMDEFLVTESSAFALDTGDKAIGKAFTMAMKAMLLKAFFLESSDQEEARTFEEESSYREKKPLPNKASLPPQVKTKNSAPVGGKEVAELVQMAEVKGLRGDDLKEFIFDNFKINSSRDMQMWQYELAKDILRRKVDFKPEISQ